MSYNYAEPAGFTLRDDQRATVEAALSFYDQGKRAVIIVAPTGSGKSIMARTIASAFPSGYLLTPTRHLQDQYAGDFGHEPEVAVLKGKANYFCGLDGEEEVPVPQQRCQRQGQSAKRLRGQCQDYGVCPYYNALKAAIERPLTIMNFKLFMLWMAVSRRMDAPYFGKRSLHVVDECHAIESTAAEFLGLSLKWPDLQLLFQKVDSGTVFSRPPEQSEDATKDFLRRLYEVNYRHLRKLEKAYGAADQNELFLMCQDSQAVRSDAENFIKFDISLKYMFEVLSRDKDAYGIGTVGHEKGEDDIEIIAQPLSVRGYMRQEIQGEHTLFLSATIPDVEAWAFEAGLAAGEYGVIDMPSTFPAKNRRVVFDTVGHITHKNKTEMYAPVLQKISSIANHHSAEKGIVHTPSYEWCDVLKTEAGNSLRGRLLVADRREMKTPVLLELHKSTKSPTVIMTPAMKEGVDLKDDLARFQIIVKCPFGSLGHPRTAKKAARSSRWYANETICSFMQQVGRSTRGPDDWSVTYVLDAKLAELLRKHWKKLPQYFREALVGL